MPKWNELELKEPNKSDKDLDYAAVPEQRGAPKAKLPEADFAFALAKAPWDNWEIVRTKNAKDEEVERPKLNFVDEPLVVLQAPSEELVGAGWYGNISGQLRKRSRKGEPLVLVSDLANLFRYGLGDESRPLWDSRSFKDAVAAFERHQTEVFIAHNVWSTYCSTRDKRYIQDPDTGQSVEDPEGTLGCGQNYYTQDIPRVDGVKQERFTCACGAYLRVFQGLTRFRRHGG